MDLSYGTDYMYKQESNSLAAKQLWKMHKPVWIGLFDVIIKQR